jgi:hypothetical protein
MQHERIEAAREITAGLIELEQQIDFAIISGGRLPGTMAQARLKARLPAATGQEAFLHAAKAFEMLVQARKHIVQAHASLAAAGDALALPPAAYGDWHECPKPHAIDAGEPHLRLAVSQ